MKKYYVIGLLCFTLFLAACGVGEMVDGALGMKETIPQVAESIQQKNQESLKEATDQLQQQYAAFSEVVQATAPDLHDTITEQLSILQEIATAETFDELKAQIAEQALRTALDDLISF